LSFCPFNSSMMVTRLVNVKDQLTLYLLTQHMLKAVALACLMVAAVVAVRELKSMEDFNAIMAENQEAWTIEFYSKYCGSCSEFMPTFEALAHGHPEMNFAKVGIDAKPGREIADHLKAMKLGLPCVQLVRRPSVQTPLVTGDVMLLTDVENKLSAAIADANLVKDEKSGKYRLSGDADL
jgi:thiol-disulfide isomerase/thioredoxin